ncbi:MAG: insulinase family protein [Cellulosilyticaceae bacterium]
MKKSIIFLIGTCLLVSGMFPSQIVATTTSGNITIQMEAKTTAPQKGDVISGFEVQEVTYDEKADELDIVLEHKKTGAKMLVMKNDAIDRGFAVSFQTPAKDDTGVNHILEHSVLGGSEKYQSNNIIFDVMNTTYTSFINAFTHQNFTTYPVCSRNEAQLMKLTDIYLDAVYEPLLLKDRKIFEREAWRYEMESKDAPLSVNGVVYNEMQGNYGDIAGAAYYNAQKTIFPASNQGNVSGGNPDEILNLTYENYVNTYKKNYHPSNSFMVLRGDVDYEKFLKLIDENYLSKYDKKDIVSDRDHQDAFKTIAIKNYDFPVAKNTDTKNKAVIDVTIALEDLKTIGIKDLTGLTIVTTLLNVETSSFKQNLNKSNIGNSYSISLGADTYQPTIHFVANDANPDKSQEFYELIMKALKETVKNGMNQELAESIFSSMAFQDALADTADASSDVITNACVMHAIFEDPLLNDDDYLKTIQEELGKGYLEKLIDAYMVNNTHVAITTTVPKAGLLEQKQAVLLKKLQAKKATLKPNEVNEMVENTKNFKVWNGQKTSQKILDNLKAVSAKDIPIETQDVAVKEEHIEGIKFLSSNVNKEDIGGLEMVFDESHLTLEELHYFKFYVDLVSGVMSTGQYTEDQLLNEVVRKCNGLSIQLMPYIENEENAKPHMVLDINVNAFKKDFKDMLKIVSEITMHSKISENHEKVGLTINNIKAGYNAQFADPLNLLFMRTSAVTNEKLRYGNYMEGLDYYNFVCGLEKKFKENPEAVIAKLQNVKDKAFNKEDLTLLFAGNASSQDKMKTELKTFIGMLQTGNYPDAKHQLPVPAKREALAINAAVQYVVTNANVPDDAYSGQCDVLTALLNNLLYVPEIRLKGGAYGATALFQDSNYIAYTFRDTDYANSLKVIQTSDEFIKSIQPYLNEKELESYILSAFAAYNGTTGEFNAAKAAVRNKMCNISMDERITFLNEIKSTKPEDIIKYAPTLEQLNKDMNYGVAASPELIEKHKDMFDVIIPLQ